MAAAGDYPIHVLDFEGNRYSGVIEFGIVSIKGNEILDTQTRLCKPSGKILECDTRLHGIRAEAADGCAPFADEWDTFRELRASGPLAAHHATVELGLLKQQWPYPPLSPDFLTGGERADWGPWIDTRLIYRALYPTLPDFGLQTLITTFALSEALTDVARTHCPEPRRRYHCALYDALAAALLITRLLNIEAIGTVTLTWLLELSLPTEQTRQDFRQRELF